MEYAFPVTEAIHFLKWNTFLNTSQTTGSEDPHYPGIVLVENIRNMYGEERRAVVYLSDDGCHDFETEVL